jgi:hypothetical protein
MEREFREYERKMNSLLHTMHEALETCNAETTSELRGLNTALANQGEVIHTQAVTIASLTSALDTCNAKWQIFEGEIDLVHDKVAALENSVCRCAQAPAPDRVPSPHFSQANSLESYRTPPIATPPRENSTPLPIAMANAVLESDEENRPPLDYETGSEADEADATLVTAEIAYRQEVSEDTTRQLVRARRRVPLGRIDPYPRIQLGTRESNRRADRARREHLLARRGRRAHDSRPLGEGSIFAPSREFVTSGSGLDNVASGSSPRAVGPYPAGIWSSDAGHQRRSSSCERPYGVSMDVGPVS